MTASRLLARRTVTGEWLNTDVQGNGTVTWGVNGGSEARIRIPYPLNRPAADGAPLWLERGTSLYAEVDGELWVGLCDEVTPGPAYLEVGFRGLSSAYDRILFGGRLRSWSPDPYDVVEALLADAHAQPHGDVGFVVVRDGAAVRAAGDPEPDVPRPVKPKRNAGESPDDYDDRLLSWEEAVDDWERQYGRREPYTLAWWEHQYVGDEIRELADEIPFTVTERHRWTNRKQLVARSELVLAAELGERRHDIAFNENANVVEALAPETDTELYANHVLVLGAGEGSAMARAESSVDDLRVRTSLVAEYKTIKQIQRLAARAEILRRRARTSVTLEQVQVSQRVAATVRLGDEIRVVGRRATGWCRVSAITRQTGGGPVTLDLDRTTDGMIR